MCSVKKYRSESFPSVCQVRDETKTVGSLGIGRGGRFERKVLWGSERESSEAKNAETARPWWCSGGS